MADHISTPDESLDGTKGRNFPEEFHSGREMTTRAKVLNAIALAALMVSAILFVWMMSSLPRIEGRMPVKGITLPVTVARDHAGIPHIRARSLHDAYFALGWTHAQDRLWQMEMQRRTGAGRLSEIVGDKALPTDRFMRTLGLYRLAQAQVDKLDRPTRDAFDAYAEGVNAWLTTNPHRLPPEYRLLGATPEKWSVADSLVWGRLMALQLTGNWRDDVLKAKLAGSLDPRALAELFPGYPADQPVTLSAAQAETLLAGLPEAAEPRLASNVWAVAGSRTASGKPLLANDPHLQFQAPILWYLASIEAPGLSIHGATVPGVPLHLIGHNGRVAWGTTTTHADTVDLFVEKLVGEDSYATPQGSARFATREEIIRIKGGGEEKLMVRETRHGPVISDLMAKDLTQPGQVVAFRATALEPEDATAQALYKMNRAVDWRGFSTALKEFQAPVQNFAFADTGGTIAFAMAGRVPVRKSGDGTLPARGWTGEGDWAGWVPPEKLPAQTNPKSGRIVNANNKVGNGGPLISATWPEGYRAQRILDLLEGRKGLTADDMARMQLDKVSLAAVELKELLGTPETADPLAAEAARLVAAWDGSADKDRPEPLIFATWVDILWHDIFADQVGEGFARLRPNVLVNVLTRQRHWCDDVTTPDAESCDQLSARALEKAVKKLSAKYGISIPSWRWGAEHQAQFKHPILTHVPVLRSLSDFILPSDGDDFTVARGAFGGEGFTHMHGAGLRAVYDLADLSKSRFVVATGQSGNPLSRHYGDQQKAWTLNQGFMLGQGVDGNTVLRMEPSH